MSRRIIGIFTSIVFLILISTLLSEGQEQWTWPEKPANLQVLPKEWPGSRLRPVMVGFTRALGVRCSHCHKGEEGKSLITYDFPSDDNPNKNRARQMLKMLGHINEDLKKIEPSGDKRVNMWCHTCHSGRPRPMTLEEELGERYRMDGLEAALAHHTDLKRNYYGKGAYNFGEGGLNSFGYEVLQNNDAAGAITVFKLNAEGFPNSANVWDSLAEAYMKAGDLKMAEKYYEKSLELNAENQNAKDMLKTLRERREN